MPTTEETTESTLRTLLEFDSNMDHLISLAVAVHGIEHSSAVHTAILKKLDKNSLWNTAYAVLKEKHSAQEIIEYVQAISKVQGALTDSMRAVGEQVHNCVEAEAVETAI